ncbi:MAG: hypothetical protein IPP78_02640 [Holophagaceae bacterium]|nr:hypothetical protein [Holophagaceae bacterium]
MFRYFPSDCHLDSSKGLPALADRFRHLLILILSLSALAAPAQAQMQAQVRGPLRVSPGMPILIELFGGAQSPALPITIRIHKEERQPSRAIELFNQGSNWYNQNNADGEVSGLSNLFSTGGMAKEFPGMIWGVERTLSQWAPTEPPVKTTAKVDEDTTEISTRFSRRLMLAPGFKFVSEQVVMPVPQTGIGFNGRHYSLKVDPPPPGFYILEVNQGTRVAYLPCLISDLLFKVETFFDRNNLQVLSAHSGMPVAGAKVWVQNPSGAMPMESQITGKDGRLKMNSGQQAFHFIAQHGDEMAFANVYSYYRQYLQDQSNRVIFAYTERPIYRPGQEVFFRAIVREKDAKNWDWVRDTSSPFWVLDPSASTYQSQGSSGSEGPLDPTQRGLRFQVTGPQWERGDAQPRGTALLQDKDTRFRR